MQNLTVVMYHYVRPIRESRYPQIKGLEFDSFVKQLKYFQKHYSVVTMEDVIAAYSDSYRLPENALLLTFDDAYVDHYTHVYPVLRKMNMQGTFFVPVKTVTEHKVLDVNKIHFILSSISDISTLVEFIRKKLEDYTQEYQLRSFSDYYKDLAVATYLDNKDVVFVKRMLQHGLPKKLRNILADQLFNEFVGVDETAFSKELYMNQYQLEELIRGGMHVGSHGYDHYWWNKLSQQDLIQEIDKSKDFLASLGCDMQAWTACYPYGSYSDTAVNELLRQGCKLAVTTEIRVADIDTDNSLLVPRMDTIHFPR